MSPDEKRRLKALFVATAMYFDQKLPDQVLQLYVDDLADLPVADVERAIGELRRDPKTTRCPLPSAIRARLQPTSNPESEASLIASHIAGCVAKIGPYQTSAARMALGPIGWEIVQMEGGWESLCESLTYDNLPTLKAQWRKTALALLERGKRSEWDHATQLEYRERTRISGGLTALADVFKQLPKPEEGA